MLAFLPSLSFTEMTLLLVIGLLLYGRNLPEAGRNLGRVVAQLKRSFQDFKEQLDKEGDLREVKKVIQDTAREVKNVANVPRAIANPTGALRDLTYQSMATPLPADEDQLAAGSDAPAAAGIESDFDAGAHSLSRPVPAPDANTTTQKDSETTP